MENYNYNSTYLSYRGKKETAVEIVAKGLIWFHLFEQLLLKLAIHVLRAN